MNRKKYLVEVKFPHWGGGKWSTWKRYDSMKKAEQAIKDLEKSYKSIISDSIKFRIVATNSLQKTL